MFVHAFLFALDMFFGFCTLPIMQPFVHAAAVLGVPASVEKRLLIK